MNEQTDISIKSDTHINTEVDSESNKSDPYISKKKLIYCCFIFLALFNNLGYVLIVTSSQQFANKLDDDKLIAFYPLALIILNSISVFINSKFCITVSYFKRALGLSCYFFFGYFFLFIALTIIDNSKNFNKKSAFLLTLIPAVIMGTGEEFGEATFVGYTRTFPGEYVSGWSSGTGFAGVVGASLSLLFKLINEKYDLKYLYLIISPITILYFFSFYTTFRIKKSIDEKNKLAAENTEKYNVEVKVITKPNYTDLSESQNDSIQSKEKLTSTDVSKNKKISIKNFPIVFRYGKRYILNLFCIYYLGYTVCYGFCERANLFGRIDSKGMFFEKAQYETFLLSFQMGIFISRSSLFIFKHLTFIELLNILQTFNFFFWLFEAKFGITTNQWICFLFLFLLGICGGGVYLACYYSILKDNKIPPEYKELCINICNIFVDAAILLSSITCIILDNTYMKKK